MERLEQQLDHLHIGPEAGEIGDHSGRQRLEHDAHVVVVTDDCQQREPRPHVRTTTEGEFADDDLVVDTARRQSFGVDPMPRDQLGGLAGEGVGLVRVRRAGSLVEELPDALEDRTVVLGSSGVSSVMVRHTDNVGDDRGKADMRYPVHMQAVVDTGSVHDIDVHIDGRSLRRERNREAVIEAFLALVREGDFDPGGAEIAERAGVSHRSVFRYFDDLADLMLTAIRRELERGLPLGEIDDVGEGPFDERLERLVDARLAMFDKVHGIATVTRLRSATIPSLNAAFAGVATEFREVLERHFAPELARFPASHRDALFDATQVLLSWDAYDVHRRLYAHDVKRIRWSTITAVTALLNP